MAEGVFRKHVEDAGRSSEFHIDSAGTGGWHAGKPPDERAQETVAKHGIDISGLRARQVTTDDFVDFDLVIAMDMYNGRNLLHLAPGGEEQKIRLFMDFATDMEDREVPDPYYGDLEGFDPVYDMIENASRGLLSKLTET